MERAATDEEEEATSEEGGGGDAGGGRTGKAPAATLRRVEAVDGGWCLPRSRLAADVVPVEDDGCGADFASGGGAVDLFTDGAPPPPRLRGRFVSSSPAAARMSARDCVAAPSAIRRPVPRGSGPPPPTSAVESPSPNRWAAALLCGIVVLVVVATPRDAGVAMTPLADIIVPVAAPRVTADRGRPTEPLPLLPVRPQDRVARPPPVPRSTLPTASLPLLLLRFTEAEGIANGDGDVAKGSILSVSALTTRYNRWFSRRNFK